MSPQLEELCDCRPDGGRQARVAMCGQVVPIALGQVINVIDVAGEGAVVAAALWHQGADAILLGFVPHNNGRQRGDVLRINGPGGIEEITDPLPVKAALAAGTFATAAATMAGRPVWLTSRITLFGEAFVITSRALATEAPKALMCALSDPSQWMSLSMVWMSTSCGRGTCVSASRAWSASVSAVAPSRAALATWPAVSGLSATSRW